MRGCVGMLAAGLLLAGCATSSRQAATAPPPPDLELVGAGSLDLPRDCRPAAGAVHRTSFVVQEDGTVARIASESGSGCAQDALRQWVSSFRYRPVSSPMPGTLDWMIVTATRDR